MKKRIAINGFGRIGRAAARIILQDKENLELVAINDPSDPVMTQTLFKYDTNFGTFPGEVKLDKAQEYLTINGTKVRNFSTRNIEDLPWGDLKIDVVLECTGVFRTKEGAGKHLTQGSKKVLLSAPAKSEGFTTIVLGVNESTLTGEASLVSCASCTTNCLAPAAKVIDDEFGIISGLMTTIHSYTNDQRILDVGHSDLRRARAAAQNIIPTTTGAAKAVGLVLPHLKGKLNGVSIRVPTPTVSLVDLVVKVQKKATPQQVNEALERVSKKMPHILGFETLPLVSSDFKGDPRSSVIDAGETMVIDDMIKVLAWYDNEWGYANRLVDLAEMM